MRLGCLVGLLLFASAMPAAQAQYFRFGKNKVHYRTPTWYYIQSQHFDIYYYEGGYELASFTAEAAEAAYQELVELFQYELSGRIPILVYQSHHDFTVTNAVDLPDYSEGIGGVTELYKNRIAVPFMGDYRDYRRVVHHELVHAVLNDMFYGGSLQSILQNNLQLVLPLWFNEGLAEYAALGWDTNSDMYVREAILNDHLDSIPYLSGYFAYRGGQSVWDYIAEQYGREKIAEILQRVRLTHSVEAGIRQATGLSLRELSERWHKALREIYYPELTAREQLDDIGRPLLTARNAGYYNTSPALSPQGDRIAFITTRNGLFDVYLASANDGKILRRLVAGQTSPDFESLRILTPGLTWSPDGRFLALAVKSGPTDAIAVINVETGAHVRYRIPGVEQILSLAWSPDGRRIAFAGTQRAQSDIYVLDLRTGETINYTNDVFSDHEPAWRPDGRALVFHSDRGPYVEPGRYQAGQFDLTARLSRGYDLYLLHLDPVRIERLTTTEPWDDRSGRFGSDPDRLLFISDRNGIPNLYEKDLRTGAERPLTDVVMGIQQVSLSADGHRAAVVSLRDGVPSIYLIKNPFERRLASDTLAPTVWAQRRLRQVPRPAPALALASEALRQRNPFLRDASYTTPPAGPLLAASEPAGSNGTNGHGEAPDSTRYGTLRVDFRNYVFSSAFDEARPPRATPSYYNADPFAPKDNVDESGRYRPRRYRLYFTPDLVYGAAGYDMLYGVQSVTQMMFSDMLGNHRIWAATNLLVDLRNSDYLIAYSYLPRRTDWTVAVYHVARLLPDYALRTLYRYRHYGLNLSASYPLNKFERFDLGLAYMGVNQTDIGNLARPPVTRTLFYPSLTYTRDVSVPGLLAPIGGHRLALQLSGSPGNLLYGRQIRFVTLLADARTYTSFGRGLYSFAFRLAGGASFGPNPQLFYSAGVENWINRRFDSFPIEDLTDFVFATPVLPLRATDINTLKGPYFGLFNAEFRFPLVAALLPGPLPLLPLYNLQGTAFLDAGAVWGSPSNRRLNLFRRDEHGRQVLDDLRVAGGLGLRTILLGFPFRFDFAWPFDGRRFLHRRFYFSVGLDF